MFHVKQRRRKFPGMFHVKQAAGLFFSKVSRGTSGTETDRPLPARQARRRERCFTWNIRGAGPQPRSMSISPMLSPRWTAMFIP